MTIIINKLLQTKERLNNRPKIGSLLDHCTWKK